MVNGLYTASASMMHIDKFQSIASNNLSNINTTGFKLSRLVTKTEVTVRTNDEKLWHQDEDQNLDEVKVAFDEGPLVQTDSDLDMALSGPGFFKVLTPEGVRYTRNGSFTLNHLGELTTLKGDVVLQDNDDTIRVDSDEKLTVMADGGLFTRGHKMGQMGVVEFKQPHLLIPRGNSYFENTDPSADSVTNSFTTTVKQRFLEGSNVDMVRTMVEMISHFRTYEASQKSLHAIDDTVRKAVTEIGRIG